MERAEVRRLAANPSFRALWIGQLISIFGDRFHYLALLALIVERARDPVNPAPELALVPWISFLPAIVFGPMAGAWIDVRDTRRVLIVSDAARGVIAFLLIPAAWYGGLPAAFALVFLLFVANAFFLPARSAIVPDLVPAESLVAANSLATLAGVLATLAGSLAGGFLVERVGWQWGFALDGATYFASVGALLCIRPLPPSERRPSPPLRDVYRHVGQSLVEGIRVARGRRPVLASLAALALLWLAGGSLHVAGTVLIHQRTAGVVSGVGSLLAATGGGMAVGTLLLAARGRRLRSGTLTAAALIGIGGSLVAFGLTRAIPALHAIAVTAGFFVALLLVTTESVIQRAVGTDLRGRIFALRDALTRMAVLSSAGLAGWLVGRGRLDPETAVVGTGCLVVLGSAIGIFVRGRARRGEGE